MKLLKLFGVSSDGALLDFVQKNPELKKSKELIELLGKFGISKEDLKLVGGGNAKEDGQGLLDQLGLSLAGFVTAAINPNESQRDILSFVDFLKAVL